MDVFITLMIIDKMIVCAYYRSIEYRYGRTSRISFVLVFGIINCNCFIILRLKPN